MRGSSRMNVAIASASCEMISSLSLGCRRSARRSGAPTRSRAGGAPAPRFIQSNSTRLNQGRCACAASVSARPSAIIPPRQVGGHRRPVAAPGTAAKARPARRTPPAAFHLLARDLAFGGPWKNAGSWQVAQDMRPELRQQYVRHRPVRAELREQFSFTGAAAHCRNGSVCLRVAAGRREAATSSVKPTARVRLPGECHHSYNDDIPSHGAALRPRHPACPGVAVKMIQWAQVQVPTGRQRRLPVRLPPLLRQPGVPRRRRHSCRARVPPPHRHSVACCGPRL